MKAKLLLPLLLVAIALGVLYALLMPTATPPISQKPAALPPAAAADGAAQRQAAPTPAQVNVLYAQPNTLDIVVKDGRRLSDPSVLRVHQGEEVTLRITSDVADEFHLHGYNLQVAVSPQRTAVLKLTADRTGRFTYEFHKSELELGALEVYPR